MGSHKIPVQETGEYQTKRIAILREINADKVDIDYTCFKQDKPKELKEAKKNLTKSTLTLNDLAKMILNSKFDAGYIKLSKLN